MFLKESNSENTDVWTPTVNCSWAFIGFEFRGQCDTCRWVGMTHLLFDNDFWRILAKHHIIKRMTFFHRTLPKGAFSGPEECYFWRILPKHSSEELLLRQTLGYHNCPPLFVLFFLETKWRVLAMRWGVMFSKIPFEGFFQARDIWPSACRL